MRQIICPISKDKINEQITRLNAIIGIVLIVAAFAFQMPAILLFLVADYFVRAFTKAKHSPISYISHWLTNTLNLGGKTVDKAPKIFAARMGFLMLLTITILFISELHFAALLIGAIYVFFATLEFALAICVGCIIYTYLIVPFNK